MQNIRTTIVLSPLVLQSAKDFAAKKKKSLSEIIEEGVLELMKEEEQQRIKRMHEALSKLEGIGGSDITDASTTIDEVLYGEDGVWRGSSE
jgi:hypothetical protein